MVRKGSSVRVRWWASTPVVRVSRRGGSMGALLPLAPIPLGLLLHALEANVVVGELLQVGESDLARHDRIVPRHIGRRVMPSMLQLDFHADPKLLHIEWRRRPVDADGLADLTDLLAAEALFGSHARPPCLPLAPGELCG